MTNYMNRQLKKHLKEVHGFTKKMTASNYWTDAKLHIDDHKHGHIRREIAPDLYRDEELTSHHEADLD